ncbi:hypothetical protein EVAR_103948_1 [Eumeta japonica]|uniref:Mariner Mos1 transposase n=1 Tax=Eumeta variegata TaxID=151549 RepID=A0A4C1YGV4_EUMVA|nr:hypothetical protein EVAR_103948_1 [Eumeta japonica]
MSDSRVRYFRREGCVGTRRHQRHTATLVACHPDWRTVQMTQTDAELNSDASAPGPRRAGAQWLLCERGPGQKSGSCFLRLPRHWTPHVGKTDVSSGFFVAISTNLPKMNNSTLLQLTNKNDNLKVVEMKEKRKLLRIGWDLCEGRLSTTTTENNISGVRLITETDKRVTYQQIRKNLGINMSQEFRSTQQISLTCDDGLRPRQPLQHVLYEPHVGARLQVAHAFAQDGDEHGPYLRLHTRRYKMLFLEHLEDSRFKEGASNLVWDIVKGDETWIYCYDSKTYSNRPYGVYRDELKPTKVARERSASKRIIASFLNKTGYVAAAAFENCRTMTKGKRCTSSARRAGVHALEKKLMIKNNPWRGVTRGPDRLPKADGAGGALTASSASRWAAQRSEKYFLMKFFLFVPAQRTRALHTRRNYSQVGAAAAGITPDLINPRRPTAGARRYMFTFQLALSRTEINNLRVYKSHM